MLDSGIQGQKLADESLHIANAFQAAGFAHLIGSLWSAEDGGCLQVAKLFYENLTRSGRAQDSNRAVAAALRSAVLQVLGQFVGDPSLWAAFIHSGA